MRTGVELSLQDKVALITGGSRGIGAASVRMFVRAGSKVVFSYQRSSGRAKELVKECGDKRCAAVQAELDDPKAAKKLVEAAVKKFGRLDCLVANHGIWPPDDVP